MPHDYTRRQAILISAALAAGLGATSCKLAQDASQGADPDTALGIDASSWRYNEDDDVYYQVGIPYCTSPQDSAYEALSVYVPGGFLLAGPADAEGYLTCTVNADAEVGGLHAPEAPIVMPISGGNYRADLAQTAYDLSGLEPLLSRGMVVVRAGFGRPGPDESRPWLPGCAPWGVVDLKAAIRFLRYSADALPGNTDDITVCGLSGGGGMSCIVGVSGDDPLFEPYLSSIGALMQARDGTPLSDAIANVACWCPATGFDVSNGAYEWMMGQFVDAGEREVGTHSHELSLALARRYAGWVNDAGLTLDDTPLTLSQGSGGAIMCAGSYHEHVLGRIERSLARFLSSASFPLELSPVEYGAGKDDAPVTRDATTFATVEDYLSHLNRDQDWVSYDSTTGEVRASDLGGFVTSCRDVWKGVCAYDGLGRDLYANSLFGTEAQQACHFEELTGTCLEDLGREDEAAGFSADLELRDALDVDTKTRERMYNPLWYLLPSYGGERRSTVAPRWRIRAGVDQGDMSMTTEINLALALGMDGRVSELDFELVWAQAHTWCEEAGDAMSNLADWLGN